MKIIIFISFLFLSLPSYAIEFYRCTDANGKVHLTNMPKSSLDANCQQKTDYYTAMLEQDYLNLSNQFQKYETEEEITDENASVLQTIAQPALDLLDSNKALEELLENTKQKRNSPVTKFFRARTNAVENIMDSDKPTR